MILKRSYDEPLAQASFLLGCPAAGEAIVIDPNRDVEAYIRDAAREGLRIVAVTETHIHADYLSGARELADRTGATLYLSDEGDADWKYAFADQPNVRLIREGSTIRVGGFRLDVLGTPGHTPEHVSFVLTDEAASEMPLGVFTGDFVFAGDVGRPDLLERAAHIAGTMEKGARTLYDSLQRFRQLPGHLILWPGHGAGSACGKALGGVPISTLAYEQAANWAFRSPGEEAFVEEVLAGQPEPPAYFKEMKRLNKEGPPFLGGFPQPPRLAGDLIEDVLAGPGVVLDTRPDSEVVAGYIPGTWSIPVSYRSFTTWAGSLIPFDAPVTLIALNAEDAAEAVRRMAMIGLDHVKGWMGPDALAAYESKHGLARIDTAHTDLAAVAEQSGRQVLDVRSAREFAEGHIPGALHIPLGDLRERIAEVPSKPLVVHCAGGGRSHIATTLLASLGHPGALNYELGFDAYATSGLPVALPRS